MNEWLASKSDFVRIVISFGMILGMSMAFTLLTKALEAVFRSVG